MQLICPCLLLSQHPSTFQSSSLHFRSLHFRKLGSALSRNTGAEESICTNQIITRSSLLLQKGLTALLPKPSTRPNLRAQAQCKEEKKPNLKIVCKYLNCLYIMLLLYCDTSVSLHSIRTFLMKYKFPHHASGNNSIKSCISISFVTTTLPSSMFPPSFFNSGFLVLLLQPAPYWLVIHFHPGHIGFCLLNSLSHCSF